MYTIKPVEWIEKANDIHCLKTAFNHYTIRFDDHEKQYRIVYEEFATQRFGFTLEPTVEGAKNWVINKHYPAQILKHFDEV